MLKAIPKEYSFQISSPRVVEILGGLFLGLLFRWSGVVFALRAIFASSALWSGIAGPEYLILGIGYFSRWGAGALALFTALSGGIHIGQLAASLLSLGVLEWRLSRKESKEECDCFFFKIIKATFFWPFVSLIFIGWIFLITG